MTSVMQGEAPPRLAAALALPLPPERLKRAPVTGLVTVELSAHRRPPACAGTPSAVRGLRFERAIGRALAPLARSWDAEETRSGQWLRYYTLAQGWDLAQPDHYVVLEDRVLLLECKLSATQDAFWQLEQIYAPLLAKLYERPVIGCAVFNYLAGGAPPRGCFVPALRQLAFDEEPAKLASHRYAYHAHDPKRLA